MRSWFHSLQFRLILGFIIVLALALSGVSLLIGFAVHRQAARFQERLDDLRSARIERLVSDERIACFVGNPPDDTRAWTRAIHQVEMLQLGGSPVEPELLGGAPLRRCGRVRRNGAGARNDPGSVGRHVVEA